jgi:hypothetical protein
VRAQGAGHRLLLQAAEERLAALDEQVGDGLPGDVLDVGVGVAEGDAEQLGDRRADGRLARRRRSDEDQDGTTRRFGGAYRIGSASR